MFRALSWLVIVLCASPALGQITFLGTTNSGSAPTSSSSLLAYDDKHDALFHVWGDSGNIVGRFIGSDGVPKGTSFVVSPSATVRAVAYSGGSIDDVFFVLSSAGGQLFRFTGTGATGGVPVGSSVAITSGFDVLFNPLTRRFVTASATSDAYDALIAVSQFSAEGAAVGSPVRVTDRYAGWAPLSGIRIVLDWKRQHYLLSPSRPFSSNTVHGVSTAIVLDAEFRPRWQAGFIEPGNRAVYLPEADGFLIAWNSLCRQPEPCGPYGYVTSSEVRSTLVPSTIQSGSLPASVLLIPKNSSLRSLDYDPACRCVLVIAGLWGTSNDSAVLLDGTGNAFPSGDARSGVFQIPTPGGTGLLKSTRPGQFALSYIANSTASVDRFAASLASAPGPRFTNAVAHIDGPQTGTAAGAAFTVGGWTVDFASTDSTGIDALHVWAFPSDGRSPMFLGADSTFHDRSDVAAAFGAAFVHSGFDVSVSGLTPGTYTVAAYAHDRISGEFVAGDAVTVTVASQPRMNLDSPVAGTASGPIVVGGWAVDLGAGTAGIGVDTIHVWAFPAAGGAPVFLGAADSGRPRADVAAVFGSQFLNSGFLLNVSQPLAPGPYRIVAYARSTVTGSFSLSQSADVTIPASRPAMAIDAPGSGTQSQPMVVAGWAVDRGALSGTGVDAVHVYAFPLNNGSVGGGVLLGAAALGGQRPDLGAVFGSSFAPSGYSLTVSGLTAGQQYIIGVYAHSIVVNTFNPQFVTITAK